MEDTTTVDVEVIDDKSSRLNRYAISLGPIATKPFWYKMFSEILQEGIKSVVVAFVEELANAVKKSFKVNKTAQNTQPPPAGSVFSNGYSNNHGRSNYNQQPSNYNNNKHNGSDIPFPGF